MAVERVYIEEFLELAKQHPVIDVRSPAEYKHAHLPGAISLPLFTDEERKVVGTTYKQQNRQQAIKTALEYFGPNMKKMVEATEEILNVHSGNANSSRPPATKSVLVYCWRGGMRSGAVSWLLDTYGFKIYTLEGGYKSFRNYILDTFTLPFNLKILGGYTGSGKTELLNEFEKSGHAIIDLENIANHKGSAFGNIGMPEQPGQEMFENKLGLELRARIEPGQKKTRSAGISFSPFAIQNSPIWIEDESQRIGLVNLPKPFWATMRQSKLYFIDIPFEERLEHIVEEYGALDQSRMIEAIGRIKDKLGSLNAKKATELMIEGDVKECFRILLSYYDKFYAKALQNRENINSLLQTIECSKVTTDNASSVAEIKNDGVYSGIQTT